MLLVIPCAFLNKQAEGSFLATILLSKWQVLNCDVKRNPVLNLKPKAEKFEKRVTVKIIIERIIKALLKGKIFIVSN